MAELPTGTVTFLFTDIEQSTQLLGRLGDRYGDVLARHHELLRASIRANDGVEVMTEGDAFFVVFRSPMAGIQAAVQAQRTLHAEPWPDGTELRVRMGLHTGEAVLGGDNYVGLDVHRAARIAAAGHGGQVLISNATRALVEHGLPDTIRLRDLASHRLRDLPHPEHVYQVEADDLAATFPPIRSLDARPNNLPAPLTSFVGREAQIEEIRRRLAATRLLTLTGPGGTGKTRLSIRVAEEVLGEYPDGCWFVTLDALRDPELVPSAIAGALGVTVPADRPVIDALADWLAGRELLLVLDNFEQVAGAAAHVGRLLAAAPKSRVLATSRTPLHLYGEAEYAVPALATVAELRSAAGSAERLSQYEAVRLFIERAVAVRPDFRVTNANAPALAELCAQLDGLPLAIELAAARVKLLSVEQILARLQGSLGLLASTAHDLPERQRTLHGAIDWSYDLLNPPEQLLFARLSVFRGGFALEAAEAVCLPGLGVDGFEALASLVDNSLLQTIELASETRFAMLETIRQYTAEKLAGGADAEEVRRRHAAFYFALAAASEEHLTGADHIHWLDRLEREQDNLRAAFDRAVALGLHDDALAAAGAIWRYWQQRGHFAEARAIFERLLAAGGSPASRAKALTGGGGIAYWQGDYAAVGRWYGEARQLYEALGDRVGTAEALYNESYVHALAGELELARELVERSQALFAEAGHEEGVARAGVMIGYTHYFSGEPLAALPHLERAVAIYRRADERWHLADVMAGLGFTYGLAGDWPAAMAAVRESLRIFGESGVEVGTATVVEGTAAIAAWTGDAESAARLIGAADAIKQRLGGGAPSQFIQSEQYIAKAREELGREAFELNYRAGMALSVEAAAALATSFTPPAGSAPMPPPQLPGQPAEATEPQPPG